jgi:hypothetical protein
VADVIFVSVLVAFFALCVAYLKWCDRIIGPDEFRAEHDDSVAPYVATGPTLVDAPATEDVTA